MPWKGILLSQHHPLHQKHVPGFDLQSCIIPQLISKFTYHKQHAYMFHNIYNPHEKLRKTVSPSYIYNHLSIHLHIHLVSPLHSIPNIPNIIFICLYVALGVAVVGVLAVVVAEGVALVVAVLVLTVDDVTVGVGLVVVVGSGIVGGGSTPPGGHTTTLVPSTILHHKNKAERSKLDIWSQFTR